MLKRFLLILICCCPLTCAQNVALAQDYASLPDDPGQLALPDAPTPMALLDEPGRTGRPD